MSEYQYYEFQAIDRPLTEKEQKAIGKLSSRVILSPHRAVFTYNYGDFPARAEDILAKHFDAMLYVANWGSRQLMFRFPTSFVDLIGIDQYCVEGYISLYDVGEYFVLNIDLSEEEGSGWLDGEGWLSSLVTLRGDVLKKDYRLLYLAWLKAITWAHEEELDESSFEPPVPPGLKKLSKPLHDFVELFEVDENLIRVASERSEEPIEVSEEMLHEAITKLSREECNAFLLRLAKGTPHTSLEINKRLHEILEKNPTVSPVGKDQGRTVAQLLKAAEEERERQKKRQAKEAEAKRKRELETLSKEEPKLWQKVDSLIQKSQSNAYDEAVRLLLSLREVSVYKGKDTEFEERLNEICKQYSRRSSLMARLRKEGLC